jgi:nitrate/nitrite-specific signal transduction histidine kinase
MIDPSFDTMVTPYPMTMQELEVKYRELEQALQRKTQDWEFVRQELTTARTQVYELEDYLKANYSDMDESHAEQIAAIFNIKLEREYFVTITATFSGTVTAPIDYDLDDLENDLQATIDTHHYGNSDVYVDLSEDRMEIDWQES